MLWGVMRSMCINTYVGVTAAEESALRNIPLNNVVFDVAPCSESSKT